MASTGPSSTSHLRSALGSTARPLRTVAQKRQQKGALHGLASTNTRASIGMQQKGAFHGLASTNTRASIGNYVVARLSDTKAEEVSQLK